MTEQTFDGKQAVSIRNLKSHVGETVLIQGWLYNMRSKGKLHFLQIRDGTGIVQAVMFKGDVEPEDFEAASKLTQESSLRVIGEGKADERAQSGVELKVEKISVSKEGENPPGDGPPDEPGEMLKGCSSNSWAPLAPMFFNSF